VSERRSAATSSETRHQRVAMIHHSAYPEDERVKREADALFACGYSVDVICLRQDPSGPAEETVDGVRVFRVPVARTQSDGRLSYLVEYGRSAFALLVRLTNLHMKNRYDLVQIHTLPDSLAFSAIPAKLMGARLVLDIHDLMPELYLSKYSLPSEGMAVRLLRFTEGIATRLVDHVVTASEAFGDRLVASGVPRDKITVVLNTSDPAVLPSPAELRLPGTRGRFTIFWHGTMVDRYGVDLALEACALARERIPNLHFVIYGFGEREEALRALADQLGLHDIVEFRGFLYHAQLAARIVEADVGIVPNRPDVHINMAYPTKLFEFVQLGVPVVATRTTVLERRFGEDSVVFCAPTAESLADGLSWVHEHPHEARNRAARAIVICEPIAWENSRAEYVSCIAATIGRPIPAPFVEAARLQEPIVR